MAHTNIPINMAAHVSLMNDNQTEIASRAGMKQLKQLLRHGTSNSKQSSGIFSPANASSSNSTMSSLSAQQRTASPVAARSASAVLACRQTWQSMLHASAQHGQLVMQGHLVSTLHLHLTRSIRSAGAGGRSDVVGRYCC